jgi:Holliday junction resolvase RusA-like endonuclease
MWCIYRWPVTWVVSHRFLVKSTKKSFYYFLQYIIYIIELVFNILPTYPWIKFFNTFCSFFFVLKKWFELYINWHHAIGFKVMSMGRNGSSLACMTGKSHNKQLYVKWLNCRHNLKSNGVMPINIQLESLFEDKKKRTKCVKIIFISVSRDTNNWQLGPKINQTK